VVVDAVGGWLVVEVLVLEGPTPWTLVLDDGATEGEREPQPGRNKMTTTSRATSHVEGDRTVDMIQR